MNIGSGVGTTVENYDGDAQLGRCAEDRVTVRLSDGRHCYLP